MFNQQRILTDNFILEDLTYIPMGAVNEMFNRPYTVNASAQAIDTISERLHDTKSGKVSANIIGDVVGNIIQPSSVPFATCINRDWVTTRRYVFLLKVKSISQFGEEVNSYIQGYTEYDGITNTGNIDGNMTHFINNIIETTSFTISTPMGVLRKEKLSKIYNVIASQSDHDLFTQRPADIMDSIDLINMSNLVGNGSNIQTYSTSNFINRYNNMVVGSVVDNNIPVEYLSRILNAGLMENKINEVTIDSYDTSDDIARVNKHMNKLPEHALNDNRFVRYLSGLAGFSVARNLFNFNSLMKVDNTIYSRFKVISLNKDYVNPAISNTPEVGDYWTGQDPVTIKAYSLIESSVAMAIKYGFNKIYFTASNISNPTGIAEVFITNFNSFINLDEHDFNFLLEIFKNSFISEIFLSETNSGQIGMHVEGYIDLLGTSKICLTYGGFPTNWYTIPTTANSLFSPVVTLDKEALDVTSFNLGKVIESVATQLSYNANYM